MFAELSSEMLLEVVRKLDPKSVVNLMKASKTIYESLKQFAIKQKDTSFKALLREGVFAYVPEYNASAYEPNDGSGWRQSVGQDVTFFLERQDKVVKEKYTNAKGLAEFRLPWIFALHKPTSMFQLKIGTNHIEHYKRAFYRFDSEKPLLNPNPTRVLPCW